MSLILDALKRSETERVTKTQDTNSLVTSGFGESPSSSKTKVWLPFLIAALVINAIILATIVFSRDDDSQEASNISSYEPNIEAQSNGRRNEFASAENEVKPETTPSRLTLEKPTRAEMPPPREVKAATALAEELLATPVRKVQPQDQEISNQSDNAAPIVPADFAMIETEDSQAQTITEAPVTLRELNNTSLADRLSGYEVNTHIFNDSDASRSFVLINMEKYRQGDTLKGSQFEIAEITAEGVVVNHGTGQVLLSAN